MSQTDGFTADYGLSDRLLTPLQATWPGATWEDTVTIDDYRKEINRLDSELLRIFNERAALALKIGGIKKELGIPVYDPEREKRIFETISNANPGPLENDAIIRLFERVIDESRRLERIRTKGI